MRRRAWTSDPVALTLTTLCAARVTRLLMVDEFPPAETARAWVQARLPENYRHGVTCPHCVGWWVAVAATVAAEACDRAGRRRAWLLTCTPWAIAAVIGWAAEREHA